MKEFLSLLAISLTFIAFAPYIKGIISGQVKPHIFSWIIWGSTTFIVFFGQLAGGGGIGAWPIGVSGLITIFVAFLAYYKRGDSSFHLLDWVFFSISLASLPLWYFASTPLYTVLLLTFIDVVGFGPTIRKAYHNPFDEQLLFFVLMTARNFITLFALEALNVTTVAFPLVTGLVGAGFIFMVLWRRHSHMTN